MNPILYACYFPAKLELDGQYERLARVLAYTAETHCPNWDVRIQRIDPEIPAPSTGNPSHAWNTSKLDWWNDVIQSSPDGARVVLLDADMMLLRPLDAIWDQPFDLAYTIRDPQSSRLPLNGGLVAVRVSAATKAAMATWQHVNDLMCREGIDHAEFHRKYAGMNQASFGALLERGQLADLTVAQLPCQEWNCCEWLNYRENTRVVHVKSRLRRAVFGMVPKEVLPVHLFGLVTLWHRLEAEGLARQGVA